MNKETLFDLRAEWMRNSNPTFTRDSDPEPLPLPHLHYKLRPQVKRMCRFCLKLSKV